MSFKTSFKKGYKKAKPIALTIGKGVGKGLYLGGKEAFKLGEKLTRPKKGKGNAKFRKMDQILG